MTDIDLRNEIEVFISDCILTKDSGHPFGKIWREPLVGFGDAMHPYIQNLPHVVAKEHSLPQSFLLMPKIVISYFIPFTKELAQTNHHAPDNYTSPEWAKAYTITNQRIAQTNEALVKKVESLGFSGAVPEWNMDYNRLISNWSQRHIAYACGLGTFGINNMLITKRGCCGRYGSIVTDLPLVPDEILEDENCLYKRKGTCKVCVKNCFTGALTPDGFDRFLCFEKGCLPNDSLYGEEVCGKCTVGIPCASL
ncbi:epoxyqueuosine reductase QueG [Aequitasia blattaphilus]|uniref:Epoxyqueuosine reductase n=1 Tax=Aequitasia blattaphilus TaxID=2949332 RepID=A0ABT1E6B8_9FIRM|nr:epoxyqueuosine reductase [Aequitasia blattaphilus]MCP1101298.1 epoxyqueuosine reductase [Aequitasia blattaphilus]MCR8613938.1 epoxyqueuosine reductase [Aequitasia blattaphilus]